VLGRLLAAEWEFLGTLASFLLDELLANFEREAHVFLWR
jgi:hypothetical protein